MTEIKKNQQLLELLDEQKVRYNSSYSQFLSSVSKHAGRVHGAAEGTAALAASFSSLSQFYGNRPNPFAQAFAAFASAEQASAEALGQLGAQLNQFLSFAQGRLSDEQDQFSSIEKICRDRLQSTAKTIEKLMKKAQKKQGGMLTAAEEVQHHLTELDRTTNDWLAEIRGRDEQFFVELCSHWKLVLQAMLDFHEESAKAFQTADDLAESLIGGAEPASPAPVASADGKEMQQDPAPDQGGKKKKKTKKKT